MPLPSTEPSRWDDVLGPFYTTAKVAEIQGGISQAWAARLHAENSGGVLYWLRHDPSQAEGYALFGPHGEQKRWKKGRQQPI